MNNRVSANNLIKEYLLPTRVVDCENVELVGELLHATQTQAHMEYFPITTFNNGFVLLDFGKELCGGVRIVCRSASDGATVHVRFGESVGESNACLGYKGANNDHSVRDFTVPIPALSDQEWGKTGFRFVRLDVCGKAEIVGIYAVSYRYHKLPQGKFFCNDILVNNIYDTAAYTVYLNMQEYIFDGVKRDRLIWVGDMQPEVSALTYMYGKCELVEKTLREAIAHNPMPGWIVAMPTYSFWLIRIVCDYLRRTGNRQFALECLPYLEQTLSLFDSCLDEKGNCDFASVVTVKNPFFVDWPTSACGDEEEGGRFIFTMGTNAAVEIYKLLGLPVNPVCYNVLNKLNCHTTGPVHSKSALSLGYLVGKISQNVAFEGLRDGANGLTTFMSYFILSAIADCCGTVQALGVMKEYFGGMLDWGATTFWENFDLSWLDNSGRIDELTPDGKKDLHGDFGEHCYVGFRHSLCHGWSCGAVQFLTERVLGVQFENCFKIAICPDLGNLTFAQGVVPTACGNLQIEVVREDGKNFFRVTLPNGKMCFSDGNKIVVDLSECVTVAK